jgi:hypothetical protein
MRRVAIIFILLTVVSACVFNIKIEPEEQPQPPVPAETDSPKDQ